MTLCIVSLSCIWSRSSGLSSFLEWQGFRWRSYSFVFTHIGYSYLSCYVSRIMCSFFFQRHALQQKGVRKSLCFGVVSNQRFAAICICSFRISSHMCSYIVISKDLGSFDASKGRNCMILCWTELITCIWGSASYCRCRSIMLPTASISHALLRIFEWLRF